MVIPLQDGILPASIETATGTQVSYKLYLKSEAPRTNWVQWLELKPSNIPGAGLGVFTLREFTRGQAIGWYYGTKKKKSVGQDGAAGGTMYQLADLDAQGSFGYPGRLGMHVMNDPTMNLLDDAERQNAMRMWNVMLHSDYAVTAKRQIRIGEELYADYNRAFE